MTYNNLIQDLKTCQEAFKSLSKAEKESEEGVELNDKIFDIKDQLAEMESSLRSFHIPFGNCKNGML